jgi:glycosyltransferase involved in cell wall biosynthesis
LTSTIAHWTGLTIFGCVALAWVFHGLRVAYGALRLPSIKHVTPAADAECPRISLIFAARDEEEKLPATLNTLAVMDYPELEIIGVDDRSQDSTGRILDDFARENTRLAEMGRSSSLGTARDRAAPLRVQALHIDSLPRGWLGKPHALFKAYEKSSGEWLLFTDADVRFAPDALRRAASLVKEHNADHLTLFCDVEMPGFWDKVLLTFFGMAFHLATDPYRVSNPNSRAYVGVGAFQMVRRSTYEAVGTHRRLAMEVVDDIKLGKIIKHSGFRSCAALAPELVVVHWHSGLGNLVRGVTKNFFASAGFNLNVAIAAMTGVVLMNVAPFVAVFAASGWTRVCAAIAVVIAVGFHAGVNVVLRVSPFYALTHPIGAILFAYMLLRSTVVTLWRGGVTWRNTFYPLDELKRGMV